MTLPPTLLPPLLPQLEAQWVRLGAPIVAHLRPGLSEDELDAVEGRLGFPVTRELRELWSWHDGAEYGDGFCDIGPGGYRFLPTSEVVHEYELNRRIHPEPPGEPGPDDFFWWGKSWVPFMRQDAQRLYIDCSRKPLSNGGSPVRLVTEEWDGYDVDRYESLASAVSMWTWLLASDYYTWDGDGPSQERWTDIPLFARWAMT